MRIQDVIGRNVKQARDEAGLSQRQLGSELESVSGRVWLAQAVSAAERGERDWAAEDLVAIAWILRRPVQWFFKVPEGVSPWEVLDTEGSALIHLAWISGEQTAPRTPEQIGLEIELLTRELIRAAGEGSVEGAATGSGKAAEKSTGTGRGRRKGKK